MENNTNFRRTSSITRGSRTVTPELSKTGSWGWYICWGGAWAGMNIMLRWRFRVFAESMDIGLLHFSAIKFLI